MIESQKDIMSKLSVTDIEKFIYNEWLSIISRNSNRPYRRRKVWDKGFQGSSEHLYTHRISKQFKNRHSSWITALFEAPYKIFIDKPYLPLDYFCKPLASKLLKEAYNLSSLTVSSMTDPVNLKNK